MARTTKEQVRSIVTALRQAPRADGCTHLFKFSDDELGVLLRALRFYAKEKL